MEGFAEVVGRGADNGSAEGTAIIAHLLGLLAVFIGEPLTLRLIREAWPDLPLDEWHSRTEAS